MHQLSVVSAAVTLLVTRMGPALLTGPVCVAELLVVSYSTEQHSLKKVVLVVFCPTL